MKNHKIEGILKSFLVIRNLETEREVKQTRGLDVHIYEMNWLAYEQCLKELKKQLESDAFIPEVIVVVMRGAEHLAVDVAKLFPGVIIGRIWIQRTVEDGVAAKKGPPIVYKQDKRLAELINGKRVLIVDDVIKYGETMMLAKVTVERLRPNILKTAALVTAEEFRQVDFPGVPTYQQTWMVFPWDK